MFKPFVWFQWVSLFYVFMTKRININDNKTKNNNNLNRTQELNETDSLHKIAIWVDYFNVQYRDCEWLYH